MGTFLRWIFHKLRRIFMSEPNFNYVEDTIDYMDQHLEMLMDNFRRYEREKHERNLKKYENGRKTWFGFGKPAGEKPEISPALYFGFMANVYNTHGNKYDIEAGKKWKKKANGWMFNFYCKMGDRRIPMHNCAFLKKHRNDIIEFAERFNEFTGHTMVLDRDNNVFIFFNKNDAIKENGFSSNIDFNKEDLEEGKLVYGFDDLGNKISVKIEDMTHMLIAGISGSGKSVFQNVLLQSVFHNIDKFKVVLLADLKGGVEFFPYHGKHEKIRVYSTTKELREVASRSINLMNKRLDLMRSKGQKKWQGDFHLLMIDEYAIIQMERHVDKAEIEAHKKLISDLNILSAQGRAAGIRLICGLQKTTTDQMDSAFKNNLQTQVAFKLKTKLDISNVFGSSDDIKDMDINMQKMSPGQCIIYDDSRGEFFKCTVPHLKDDECMKILE